MLIKIGKKEICSLLGTEIVSLKEFVGIKWAEDGMSLSTSRSLFLGSLKVTVKWPCELKEYQKNRKQLDKALSHMFAQVNKKYEAAVAKKEEKEAKKETATPEPAQA